MGSNRSDHIKKMQRGAYNVLVTTEMMSRGIDLSRLSHVISLDVPLTPRTYLHRAGRVGRVKKAKVGNKAGQRVPGSAGVFSQLERDDRVGRERDVMVTVAMPHERLLLWRYAQELGLDIQFYKLVTTASGIHVEEDEAPEVPQRLVEWMSKRATAAESTEAAANAKEEEEEEVLAEDAEALNDSEEDEEHSFRPSSGPRRHQWKGKHDARGKRQTSRNHHAHDRRF